MCFGAQLGRSAGSVKAVLLSLLEGSLFLRCSDPTANSPAVLLSHGLLSRDIIEGGPPEAITTAWQDLFHEKIQKTKLACAAARQYLDKPPRRRKASSTGRTT